jgi:hypothetical protein
VTAEQVCRALNRRCAMVFRRRRAQVARIPKVGVKALWILKSAVTDACRIVANAELFLERLQRKMAAEVAGGVVGSAR